LALHGEPAFVADGAGSGDFSAESFREGFGLGDIFGSFDAAAYGDDDGSLREVDGGLGFFEEVERLGANLIGG
jgi:sigma54-dependent transcription regulator